MPAPLPLSIALPLLLGSLAAGPAAAGLGPPFPGPTVPLLVRVETAVSDAVFAGKLAVWTRTCSAPGAICPAALWVRVYEREKQRALCGIQGVAFVRDASFQPETVVRAATREAYEALLARPDVASVEALAEVPTRGGWHETPVFSCAFAPARRDAVWLWGDWDGDGFEEVGKYVPALDAFLLDRNGNGLWDGAAGGDALVTIAPALGPGEPLVGDWNGDGADGVGKRIGSRFLLDANENGLWDGAAGGDRNTAFAPGQPADADALVADWDGDGSDDIGLHAPGSQALGEGDRFLLDGNGDGLWSGRAAGDGLVLLVPLTCRARPVAVDWDPEIPGASVGKVFGSSAYPFTFGYLLDLTENGRWDGNQGGDLALPPRVTPFCGGWATHR
jgi:hypothetical protein